MDDEENNSTIDTSSLTIPIIEENDKLLSSLSSNIPITSPVSDEKVMINQELEEKNEMMEDKSSQLSDLEPEPIQSPQTILTSILQSIITEIESKKSSSYD